jgi:hypothetical protein
VAAFPELDPDERRLAGAWADHDGGRRLDEVDRRIFWLVTRRLIARGQVHQGWEQLYQDPRDGRFWELTFPEGSLHGGGPRLLTCIDEDRAREKYGVTPD